MTENQYFGDVPISPILRYFSALQFRYQHRHRRIGPPGDREHDYLSAHERPIDGRDREIRARPVLHRPHDQRMAAGSGQHSVQRL